jgi:3D (Asp-Asp-Asp) domain-containing protein
MIKPNGKLKKFVISSALVGMMAGTPIAANAELGDQTLQRGMWDQDVKSLQTLLDEKGFFDYRKATGFFGPITENGVEAFQKANDLKVDGIAGSNTFAALNASNNAKNTAEDTKTLKQGDHGEAVEGLQKKLNNLGYYTYNIDGIFGPITEDAVSDFQKANDLRVDGRAGSKTKTALNGDPVSAEDESGDEKAEKTTVSRSADEGVTNTFRAESTAYTANCDGCSGVTATGVNLNENPDAKVIAVDPDVIPLGSTVWVEGYGYAVAADVGGAIKGKKVDVFIADRNKALEWGRKDVTVKVLK